MSWKAFEDDCPGCKPALLDLRTNKVKPDDSPEMVAIFSVWEKTTLEERQAFHNVCCNNSRDSNDLRLMQSLSQRMQVALELMS